MSEDLRVKIDADVANNFENEKDNKIEYVKSILKEYLPTAIDIDGKVNFDNLKSELEKQDIKISSEKNSFQLYWAGKNEAIKKSCQDCKDRAIEPQQQESKDWNTTGNIFIEGDNLEALKMLKKSYSNKVKMIYIDPPYNTGNDFVYNDEFKISKEEYDNLTDKDREIYDKKMEAISSASGQKHSKWLSMMYPRLVAAKELLTDDGVIFISIDDNEQANLKLLCDEVFGGGNFVSSIPRVTKKGGKSTDAVAKNHDYIVIYTKQMNKGLSGVFHDDEGFCNKDEYFETRGYYKLNQTLDYDSLGYVKSLDYPIEIDGEIFYAGGDKEAHEARQKGEHGRADWTWRWRWRLFDFGYKNGFIEVKRTGKRPRIYTKTYQKCTIEEKDGEYKIVYFDRTKPLSTLEFINNVYSNDNASKNIANIFPLRVFEYSKPTSLIKKLLEIASKKTSIILDFFAGSGTTGQAVMELNNEDGGDRKFILVQLPEKISEKQPAHKFCKDNNFEPVISSITKERLRRAGAKIKQQQNLLNKVDVGFKCYKIVENPTQNQFEENLFGWNEKNNDFLLSYIALMYGYGLNFTATKIETFENREFYLLSSDMMEFASAVCILEKEPISDNDVLKLVQVLQKEYETKTLQFFARDSALSLETSWNLMQHFDKKKVVVF